LNEERVIPGIFHRLIDAWEDLRSVAREKAPEVFRKDLHAVGLNKLEVRIR
jgi:HrpA-like RNA helicase